MPELPEVETIRKDLHKHLKGQQISQVQVKYPKIVRGGATSFKKNVASQKIKSVQRRAKLLMVELKSGQFVLVHLKMTGQLFFQVKNKLVAGGHGQEIPENISGKHTHVIFSFKSGAKLFFNDVRKFGYLLLVDEAAKQAAIKHYGPEPADKKFSAEYLYSKLHARRVSLKAALLNQEIIAGLGNIYVDEVTHAAKIKPTRRANSITKAEAKKLQQAIKKIIAKAIKMRGTTFSDYRDADGQQGQFSKQLKVYGRGGQRCKICRRGTIKKVKVAGRGTHYCPKCQK